METKAVNTTTEAVVEAIESSETTSHTSNTVAEAVETSAEAEATAIEKAVDETVNEETSIKLNSLNSLKYIISQIYSHSYLLNKATGANIFIDERLKNDLAEADTFEEGLGQLKEVKGMELMKGIEVKDSSLLLTAFDALPNSAMKKAVRILLTLLAKSVKDKNINLHKIDTDDKWS